MAARMYNYQLQQGYVRLLTRTRQILTVFFLYFLFFILSEQGKSEMEIIFHAVDVRMYDYYLELGWLTCTIIN